MAIVLIKFCEAWPILYDPLRVMGTTTERLHRNPMKTVRGVEETKHTVEKKEKRTISMVKIS